MKLKDLFLIIIVTALWGSNFVLIKVGLSEFPPIFFCALRFIVGALPILFLKPDPKIKWKFLITYGLVLGVLEFSLLYLGMKAGVASGIASLLMQGQIIFTLLFSALFLKDRASLLEIAGVLIAIAGVVGITQSQKDLGATGLGVGLILGAAIAGGAGHIILKKSESLDMFRFVAWMSIVPPLPLLLISFIFEDHQWEALKSISTLGLTSLFYSGILSTFIGYGLWGRLLVLYSPSTITPFSLLIPIFGILSAFIFLGERLTVFQLTSASIVLIGLCITMLGSKLRLKLERTLKKWKKKPKVIRDTSPKVD